MRPVLAIMALFFAATLATSARAQAEPYPTRPVRFIVPSTPAGPTDILVRLLAENLTKSLRQQFIVDNRPGAAGRIGLDTVAKAAPDGYTLFLGSQGNLTVSPFLYRKLPYDTERDFAPIVLATRVRYLLLAHPAVPANNLKDLLALMRAKPGQMNYASIGVGSSSHLAGELFKKAANVSLLHVPYKGAAPALTDLVGGQVQFLFASPVAASPYINGGRIKAIAIAAPTRTPLLPDVATFDESGLPGFEASTWFGVMTRAGVPQTIIATLNEAINRGLRLDDVRNRLASLDAEPAGGTSGEFAAFLKSERVKWGAVVKDAGIKPE